MQNLSCNSINPAYREASIFVPLLLSSTLQKAFFAVHSNQIVTTSLLPLLCNIAVHANQKISTSYHLMLSLSCADSRWVAVKGAFDSSSPAAAENAAVAAAALAAVLPPGSHATVTEVVQKLRAGMDSR